jgi:SAM-dependent methyltransferase
MLNPTGRTPDGLIIVPCVICDSRDTRPRYRKFDLAIVECAACGLVFANPRLPQEEIVKRYSADYFWHEYLPSVGAPGGVADLDFFDRRFAPWVQMLNAAVGRPGRLFEIGTGAGLLLKTFERAGWQVAGLELNRDAAEFARDRLQLAVTSSTAETLDHSDGQFDAVAMLDVIEHLGDPLDIVTRARRLLRAGGVLVVQTPNYQALTRHALGSPWAVLSPAEHLYYFTEATLTRLLAAAGFEAITFEWRFAGYGPLEAMNPRYTHAPGALRARAYEGAIRLLGTRLLAWVQALYHEATEDMKITEIV